MITARHRGFGAYRRARVWPAQRTAVLFSLSVFFGLTIAGPAFAAQPASSENSLLSFVAELGVLLFVGRIMGEAAQRIGQPPVMGQLMGGLMLGPSLFGLLWPSAQHALFPPSGTSKSMIEGVSQLGILMLLLLTGTETDLQLAKRVGRTAVIVAVAGVAIPFICGVSLGEMLPSSLLPKPDARTVTALFLGIALSISSVKIVAMVVREMNFMRRDIGQIIVASAILEDTIGWIIIAIAFGLASAGAIDAWSVGRAVIGTFAFLAASLTIGRRIVSSLIRWANDNFESEFPVITTILVIMAAMALTTQWIGVNVVLGAFVAGILVGESPILTRHIDEQLRGLIVSLFMPVFFGLSGLGADLTVLKDPRFALLAAGLILIACVGKFLGAFIGGKLGGLGRAEALALGCAMNARGSTEVIVASIGLSMGVLSQNLFTLIVTMAVVTTVSMPPMLRWALKRLPMRKDEKLRLEREELDARGFVTNLERLLVVVDDSVNGKFAARLAGVLGGATGKPATILEMTTSMHSGKPAKKSQKAEARSATTGKAENSEEHAKSAAERVTTLDAHPDEEKQGSVEVTTVPKGTIGRDEIAEEARKGYDLLVIGIAKMREAEGGFSKDVSRIAQGFDGPLAVIDAHGASADALFKPLSKILIPVNGTEVSRRAAEVGFALARANAAQVTVLYVTRTAPPQGKRNGSVRARTSRRNDDAILKDIAALAQRYDVALRRSKRSDVAPDEAIIAEAQRGYGLIVLGANRRPGETLFFGETAAAVLNRSEVLKVFVTS